MIHRSSFGLITYALLFLLPRRLALGAISFGHLGRGDRWRTNQRFLSHLSPTKVILDVWSVVGYHRTLLSRVARAEVVMVMMFTGGNSVVL